MVKKMSEFKQLYYQDCYLQTFEATVLQCVPEKQYYKIVLDQTAFYPEGGGQPADHGYLKQNPVFDVRKKDGVIYHYCQNPLPINEKISGTIDFERRFDLMQQHSGEHIFSGIVHRLFGYDNIGFHLADDVITLDFSGPLDWQQVLKVEELANDLIYRNVEVKQLYPSKEQLLEMDFRSKKELTGEVRIIEIPDGDICACCGTHVKNTGEIGIIKALSCANKNEGSRVVIICGKRAYRYLQQNYNQTKKLSVELAAKPLELQKAVSHLQKQISSQKEKLYLLQKAYFEEKIKHLKASAGLQIVFEEKLDQTDFRKYIDEIAKQKKGKVVCGFNCQQESYHYVIISYEIALKGYHHQINELLCGKGSGNDSLLQGICHETKENIIAKMKEVFADL